MLFELLEFASTHGNHQLNLHIGQFITVFSSLISEIGKHKRFLAMEPITHSIEVVPLADMVHNCE